MTSHGNVPDLLSFADYAVCPFEFSICQIVIWVWKTVSHTSLIVMSEGSTSLLSLFETIGLRHVLLQASVVE